MEIPREFAHLPRIAELVSIPNPQDVNCHKAVLYLADRISYEELTSDARQQKSDGLDFTYRKQALAISDAEFTPIANTEELLKLARQECLLAEPYIGQILDAADRNMAHSFILIRAEEDFICFDKAGFKEPFTTLRLEKFLDFANYQNQEWRFIPLAAAR